MADRYCTNARWKESAMFGTVGNGLWAAKGVCWVVVSGSDGLIPPASV